MDACIAAAAAETQRGAPSATGAASHRPPTAPPQAAAHADVDVYDACSRCIMQTLRALRMLGARHAAMLPMMLPKVLQVRQGFQAVDAAALMAVLGGGAAKTDAVAAADAPPQGPRTCSTRARKVSPESGAVEAAGNGAAGEYAVGEKRKRQGGGESQEGGAEGSDEQVRGGQEEPVAAPAGVLWTAGGGDVGAAASGRGDLPSVDLLKVALSWRGGAAMQAPAPAGEALLPCC